MTDATTHSLFVLIEREPHPFLLRLPLDATIGQLRETIWDYGRGQPAPNYTHLVLVKVDMEVDPSMPMDNFRVDQLSNAKELFDMERITFHWPEGPPPDKLHVIVQRSIDNPLVPQLVMKPDDDPITFMLPNAECYRCLMDQHLVLNKIVEVDPAPEYLQTFREQLMRPRYIKDLPEHAVVHLQSHIEEFDTYFQGTSAPNSIHPLDYVTESELGHYLQIFISKSLTDYSTYMHHKESQVQSLVRDFLVPLGKSKPSISWSFGKAWKFHLVVTTDGNHRFSVTPRSDVLLSIDKFPHIAFEVISDPYERDCIRMLIQAGCLARVGNHLQKQHTKPFIAMAIYIDDCYRARLYLVHQPRHSSPEVEYNFERFDLTNPNEAFKFIFQLYNFISLMMTQHSSFVKDLSRLRSWEIKSSYPAISGSKRKAKDDVLNTRRHREHPSSSSCFSDSSVQANLATAGYRLEEEMAELQPLPVLQPTIRRATSSQGLHVVLKLLDGGEEVEFLKYFRDIKDSANHTIPLLQVINLDIGKTVVALPQKLSLDDALQSSRRYSHAAASCCTQLVEGVAFLHEHKVAHRDLKPANVVVEPTLGTSLRLFIIDFDLALKIEGEEQVLPLAWCGTLPWVAPEVGTQDGPIQQYSPILADRWACGAVIKYIAKYHSCDERELYLAFAEQLLSSNPRARPSLNTFRVGPVKRKSAEYHSEAPFKRPVTIANKLQRGSPSSPTDHVFGSFLRSGYPTVQIAG